MKCRFVSWDEVVDMCKQLAEKIEENGYIPEVMVGLARSGFVPSRILSDLLGVTNLVALKVEHWLDTTGEHKDEATIPYEFPLPVEGKKVLVVDDIVDTGKSMEVSVGYLRRFKPSTLKTAVMQYITSSQHVPDYYAVKVEGWTWFIYPWNVYEDLSNLTGRLLKASGKPLTLQELLEGFSEKFELKVDGKLLGEVLRRMERRGKIVGEGEAWRLP